MLKQRPFIHQSFVNIMKTFWTTDVGQGNVNILQHMQPAN